MRSVTVVSDLELAILGFLSEEPRSGYELRKILPSDSPGAVYPALRRLTAAALIEGSADQSTRRGKERFHVTAAGRRALRDALAKPIGEDEIRRKPDACLLRLRFLEPSAAGQFLDEYARLTAKRAAELRRDGDFLALHDSAIYSARARSAVKVAAQLRSRKQRAGTPLPPRGTRR